MQLFERIIGSGMTTLTISNEEMDDIMKIVQSLSAFFIKGVSKAIKKRTRITKGWISGHDIRHIRC